MSKTRPKGSIPARYKVTGKKFSGGFGEVSIFHDEFLDRDVAVKRIHDATQQAQLADEVLAVGRLRSKHVVQLFDVVHGADGSIDAIIAEYVPGDDLRDFATSQPYSPQRYLRTIYQIACGISDIHEQGLVHRDIKLNNIKVDGEGIIKIFDFGLSSLNKDHETVAGRGTLLYAAPELYTTPVRVEKSLDTYAFGICCWLLLNNKTAPSALQERPPQSKSRPPSLSTKATGLSAELTSILDATLDPDPTKRPEMSEIRDLIALHLVEGKHRAWLSGGYRLVSAGQRVKVGSAAVGTITIGYDGLRFKILDIQGDAFVNNQRMNVGDLMMKSCVITIGADVLQANRSFVEFVVSHPEVVL